MNLNVTSVNIKLLPKTLYQPALRTNFKSNPKEQQAEVIPVYGESPIRTNPAQLSLFALHDFHGQNLRMER